MAGDGSTYQGPLPVADRAMRTRADGKPVWAKVPFGTRVAKTGAYTVVAADRDDYIDATSGTWTLTLTAAATLGDGFSFIFFNSGTRTVTADADGAETIRDQTSVATTKAFTQGQGGIFMCDGTGWHLLKVTAGAAASSYTEVDTHADLPVTVGTPTVGTVYLVKTSSGAWYTFDKKEKGLWRRTANNGDLADWTRLGDASELTVDSTFALSDEGDGTKRIQFQLSGITTATTRTLTFQDASGTIALVATTVPTSYLDTDGTLAANSDAKVATQKATKTYADTKTTAAAALAAALAGRVWTGDHTFGENTGLVLDAALSADGKYCGIVEAGTAGATLAFGDLCYLAVADSRWELTDADAEATAGPVKLGICVLAAAGDGSATTMLLWGKVRADAAFPTFTVGAPAYVSTTAGDLQVAQPSGTDDVIRMVGYGNTADELFFCPSNDYMTHT